ncbi:hypothetical protein CLV35_1355 [Motilibacter peucedani]|uniref:Uncharacterized protein n=1 Tax=Motilibacter peucedani TaxID=598650 RepID=A0A420XS71_9ACTN|nr:hypothetical protein [Motilibacter peucedani]RKS77661.1 hypothetical protein CLV35_1355 [Motilibacter peucedani]
MSKEHVDSTGNTGGEPSFGTGPLGSRMGGASLNSAAGTASLRERPTDAGDETDALHDSDLYVVTDAGQHLAVRPDATGRWTVEDRPDPQAGGSEE